MSHNGCDLSLLCRQYLGSKEPNRNCMLFFFRDMIILDSTTSILRGYREKWVVCDQEGLHLVTHGDGLTFDYIVRFNMFLTCQTYRFQLELLVDNATELEFGNCIMFRKWMILRSIDTVCSYVFFFTYSVIQRVVTGYGYWSSW